MQNFKANGQPVLVLVLGGHSSFNLALNFIKKRLQHRCFPVYIPKLLEQFFYRTLPVAASKWGNRNSQKEQTKKIVYCSEEATGDAL